jgi:hypothetical protein
MLYQMSVYFLQICGQLETELLEDLESITLSIAPTAGSSILNSKDNQGFFTFGEDFKKARI